MGSVVVCLVVWVLGCCACLGFGLFWFGFAEWVVGFVVVGWVFELGLWWVSLGLVVCLWFGSTRSFALSYYFMLLVDGFVVDLSALVLL